MTFKRHTIKPGTPAHGTTEHGTSAEYRNTGGTLKHWRNIQPNTDRTIEIPRNSGT